MSSTQSFMELYKDLSCMIGRGRAGHIGSKGYDVMQKLLEELVRLHNEQIESMEDERIDAEHAMWVASTSEGYES